MNGENKEFQKLYIDNNLYNCIRICAKNSGKSINDYLNDVINAELVHNQPISSIIENKRKKVKILSKEKIEVVFNKEITQQHLIYLLGLSKQACEHYQQKFKGLNMDDLIVYLICKGAIIQNEK